MADKYLLLKGHSAGQKGRMKWPGDATKSGIQSFMSTYSVAGQYGLITVTPIVIESTAASEGANLDNKIYFTARDSVTNDVVRTVWLAPTVAIETERLPEGERVTAESGQDFIDAWATAAKYANPLIFLNGTVVTHR